MNEYGTISQVRDRFAEIIDEVSGTDTAYVISRDIDEGPKDTTAIAVLIGVEYYEQLMEAARRLDNGE